MHRAITNIDTQIDQATLDTDRQSLGNLDLLNLRLNQRDQEQVSCVEGSGDHQEAPLAKHNYKHPLRRLNLVPSCHKVPHGYDSGKISSKLSSESHRRITLDDFLLPPRRKSSNELSITRKSQANITSDSEIFPFKHTPSGNLQVKSHQVVFESKKLSVLVANPEDTKVNVYSEEASARKPKMAVYGSAEFSKNSAMDAILSQAGISGLGSLIGDTPVRSTNKVSSEYESKQTSEILDPELNLSRLGYSGNEPIDWNKVTLPDKKDLYLELCRRITHKKNADCKVNIGREEFSCHLIVLQCYSQLFDGYIAIKKVEIPPEKCTASSFSYIYDWMVSEEQSYKYLNRENVLDIFNSAKYLKIKDLVEQCWAFVDNIDVFNEDTAFLLYVDAKARNVEEVRELMIPRIQDFFLILVSSQDWLELSVDDVNNLLSSNYIRINCEMEVFMSAVRWLKYDWANRDKYKYDVLNCVRFGNIAPWQLVDIKRNPENPEFMELARDPKICKLIDDGLAFVIIKYWYGQENDDFQHWNSVLGLQEPPPRNWSGLDKTYFTYREFLIYLDQYRRNQLIEKSKPRMHVEKKAGSPSRTVMPPEEPVPSMEDFLSKKKIKSALKPFAPKELIGRPSSGKRVSIYGVDSRLEEDVNTLKLFTASKNNLALKTLNQLSVSVLAPRYKEYYLESSLFLPDRETILVFGGIDPHVPYGEYRNTATDIYRYLPDLNKWEGVGELPEPRRHHSVCFLKGRIYLAGGTDPRADEVHGKSFVVNTMWSFEPVRRCWFSEPSLGEHRRNFGLIACQRKIFAIGGCNRDLEPLATVERFDPKCGTWTQMAPMHFPRAGVACAKYRHCIWAAGGTVDLKKNTLLNVVESYNVKSNQWTKITRLNVPRSFSCMFVMADILYLIGGIGHKLNLEKSSCSIGNMDVWDAKTVSWRNLTNLDIPRHGHAVAYVGTQIFVMGGVTTIYTRCLNKVECFCTQRESWIRGVACLPTSLSGHAAITLPPAMLISDY